MSKTKPSKIVRDMEVLEVSTASTLLLPSQKSNKLVSCADTGWQRPETAVQYLPSQEDGRIVFHQDVLSRQMAAASHAISPDR